MYKDGRYINAGVNEFYRYGAKAIRKLESHLEPNVTGYITIPTDAGDYWTIGTSDGKYGEYASIYGTFFSVNKMGNVYAKVGTEKGEKLIEAIKKLMFAMKDKNAARAKGEI